MRKEIFLAKDMVYVIPPVNTVSEKTGEPQSINTIVIVNKSLNILVINNIYRKEHIMTLKNMGNKPYQLTTAWREAQKALEEQNKINKDMFIKIKEWWC